MSEFITAMSCLNEAEEFSKTKYVGSNYVNCDWMEKAQIPARAALGACMHACMHSSSPGRCVQGEDASS